ncbi:MAG: hypothetical protein IPJ66_13460 [Bacteroidetes bacterium]|nr:hypothetical protein [Bacteroidota bacterium]
MRQIYKSSTRKHCVVFNQPVDIKFEMVMNHFEMCRIMINQIFEEIIREKRQVNVMTIHFQAPKNSIATVSIGSIKMGDHRLPVEIPESGNLQGGKCVPLLALKT